MAISDLPEITDSGVFPSFDQQATNITSLILKNDAIVNPLCGDLAESSANLSRALKASSGIKDDDVKRLRDHVSSTSAATFSDYDGTTSKLKTDLTSALTSLIGAKQKINSALGQVTRFGEHANKMIHNVNAVGAIVNSTLSIPQRLTSDITNGLPSSFPSKIPSFLTGPDKLPIPNLTGFSLPEIPKFNIAASSIPTLPNAANLPGISVPGIPNPTDALKAFAGSITAPKYGGVGKLMTEGFKKYSKVAGDLMGNVSGKVSSMIAAFDPPTAEVGSLSAPVVPPVEALAGGSGGIADMAAAGQSVGALKNLADGTSNMIGGETGAIFGSSCTELSDGGGACGGRPSIPTAMAQAGGIVQLAKTKTSAKILDSVASQSLKKQFPGTLS